MSIGIGIGTEGFVTGLSGGGGGTDTSAPVITIVSPTPNTVPGTGGAFSASYAVAAATPIVVTFTDADGAPDLMFVQVIAKYLDGTTEAVYRTSDSFVARYAAASTTATITNGISLGIRRDLGWPSAGISPLAVTFQIDAIDFAGNASTLTVSWQLPSAPPFTPAPQVGETVDPDSNIVKLLTAICSAGFQPVENMMQQLLLQRTVDNAVGTQLDVVGRLVGQDRNGLDDDTFRRYCRANISAHRSKGTVEDLLRVIDLVIFDTAASYKVVQSSPATVVVRVAGLGITDALATVTFVFLRRTASSGVRLILEYGNVTPLFTLDLGPGLDVGHLAGAIDR